MLKDLEEIIGSIYKNIDVSFDKKFLMLANNVNFYDLSRSENELLSEIEDFKVIYGVSKPFDEKIRDKEKFSISTFLHDENYDIVHISLKEIIEDFCSKNDISDEEIELNVYFENLKKSVQKNIKETFQNNYKYKLNVIFISYLDILKEYQNLISKELYVDEFSFEIDSKDNYLYSPNGDIKSIVVNMSSRSIKEIYLEKGKNNGPLYHSNLRYYVKNKKIDEDITKTIDEDKNLFWFLNNGIVILCEKFEISKNSNCITLKNFSFVNGGQTTHIIGNKENLPNFYILCKIIELSSNSSFDKSRFIEKNFYSN